MNWMQTLNGTKWNLLAPRAADVDFREIAHSLSVLPRFLGHTTCPYSVAEHMERIAERDELRRAVQEAGLRTLLKAARCMDVDVRSLYERVKADYHETKRPAEGTALGSLMPPEAPVAAGGRW